MKKLFIALLLVGVAQAESVRVDLAALVPKHCLDIPGGGKMCLEGNFLFATDGYRQKYTSIRTVVIDQPVAMRFTPPVYQVDFVAHANPGEECEIPTVTFCGTNLYDMSSRCQTEPQLSRDALGCSRSTGQWAFGTPVNRELLIEYVEVRNMELWGLAITTE